MDQQSHNGNVLEADFGTSFWNPIGAARRGVCPRRITGVQSTIPKNLW
jgi:hypothetical protein